MGPKEADALSRANDPPLRASSKTRTFQGPIGGPLDSGRAHHEANQPGSAAAAPQLPARRRVASIRQAPRTRRNAAHRRLFGKVSFSRKDAAARDGSVSRASQSRKPRAPLQIFTPRDATLLSR